MVHLKSKRGVALPTAIAVTAILIILTTSLIFIAMNSVSNTSSDTSTRQAYINAKSALNYAASYYNSGASLPSSGTPEYVVMEDTGGTGLNGASIKTVEADAESYNTFVEAVFIPRTTMSDQDKLKLTAYAQSSDAWGSKAKTVRLTATYNITNKATIPKRITSIIAKNGSDVSYDPPDDTITLNVRKHPDYDFVPYFYTWTYKDARGTDTGSDGEGYYYKTDSTSIGETYSRFSGDAGLVKQLEQSTSLHPSGIWNTDPSNEGPQGASTQKSGTTDWYQHKYVIAKDSVNYFNAIISRKGGMLEQTNGNINNTNHIQSCEMFHLWYADPADKNIYFEILNKNFYYYYSADWDGKKNLEDYFLVYTSRPATVVHVKVINSRSNSIEDNSASPVISALGSSNVSMKYEGCGWWTSLVETNNYFTATITVGGKSYSVNTVQGENKEVWIVIDKSKDDAIARTTESNANTYMGIDDDSYITVKAKAYKGTSSTSPTLKYRVDSVDSSTAKRNLLNRILEANDYVESDYTTASYEPLKTAIDHATVIYNDATLYTDDVYETEITALETAIDGLVVNVCDVETMNQLRTKYNNIYKTYVKYEQDGTWVDAGAEKNYDRDAFAKLIEILDYANKILEAENPITVRDATGNIVTKADGTVVTANGGKIQKSVVLNAIDALDYTVSYIELPENKLDRTPLHDKLSQANGIVGDASYTEESRIALQAQIDIAQAVYDNKSLKQSELDDAYAALDAKYQAALATKVTILDIAQLTANLTTASTILSAEKKDCTDSTYNALQSAYNSAMTAKDTATNQESIDAANATLETALKNFYIYKPYTSSDLYDENVIRVWMDASAILEGDSFESAEAAGLRVSVMKDDGEASIVDVVWDSAAKYYYFEVNKTLYNKAQITFVEGTASFVSPKFDIANQNDILVIQNTTDEGKLSVVQKKLVTLYVSDETDDYDFFTPAVEITKADGNKETIVCTVEPGAPKHYYYCRFILDQNGTSAMPVSVYQKADMTGATCGISLLEGGEHIVFFKAGGSVTTLKASTVYPKASTSTSSSTPAIGGTSISYSGSSSFSLEAQAFSSVNKGFDITKLATTTQPITVTPGTGEVLIWFNIDGISGISGSPRLYAYSETTGEELTSWGSRHSMIKYDSKHYYTTLDSKYTHVVITISGSNKLKGLENIKLNIDSSTGKPYTYQTIDQNVTSSVSSASNTAPTVTVSYTVGDLTGTTTEVSMAFVGGKYYKLTNKSYATTFGSGNGGYIYNSSKFGGYWNGYSNSSCQGRVGDTEATVMYDWYEYKLPIDAGNQYSIQVKGLCGSESYWTDSAQKIWGDSWLVLNSTTKADGRYSDVSLYSFDPNNSQVSENVTVYFKVPTSTSETWSNIKLSAVGLGASTISLTSDSNAQSMGYNYYSATISASSPYLKFEATVTDASGSTRVKQFTTALKGGDYILFDPSMNLKQGGWDTFVPPPIQLKREIVESISTYYGKVLPTSYDAYGFANGSYDKPSSFEGYVSGYLNSVKDVDDSKIPSSWASAQSQYITLHTARMAVEDLYAVMSSARSYINGRNYPEYLNRGTLATYDITSVNLLTKYDNAVNVYKSSSSSLNDFKKHTNILKTAIANISVTSQNSAIAIFGDVQGKTSSSAVQISYSLTPGGSKITAFVDQVNTENYPIYFISLPAGSDTAYDVTFTINGIETEKQNIKVDEAYVYLDYSGNAYWAKNATSGYREVKTDAIIQQDSGGYYVEFEDSGSGYMTLYFNYNTNIKYTPGTGAEQEYTIYAGAYEFMKKSSVSSGTTIVDRYGASAPFSDSSGSFVMNLFSNEAKAYFENKQTLGQYTSGLSAESLGWVDGSGALVVNNGTVAQKVNITANQANFNGSFGSTEGLYFRWTGDESITINKTFTLAGSEIKLALPTGVYGDNSRLRHFYLSANDLTADEINVTFLSDVKITYTDIYGFEHSFIIREGEYKLEKADSSLDPGVIADLFDETYWKSDKVTLLNGTEVSGGGSGNGKLDTDNIDYNR